MSGTSVGTAVLEIIPSALGFAGKLQSEIGGQMAAVGGDAGDKAGKSFGSRFAATAKSVVGPLMALFAAGAAVDFIKDARAEARESQKVGAVTEQIIRATGGAAKVTADQIGTLSEAISAKTGVDDEAIQTGANLLLTFKQVRNEVGAGNQIFDRATAAALDLSKAGFGSMDSASKTLGKALNDPIKGMAALSRAGVTFTEQQKAQIETLVKSGDVLGAQKVILGEVESQVGGVAAASATMDEKLSTSWANLKEKVGEKLLPLLDKVGGVLVEKVIPAVSDFFDQLDDPESTVGKLAGTVGDAFDRIGQGAQTALDGVQGFFSALSGEGVTSDGFVGSMERIGVAARDVAGWFKEHVIPAAKELGEKVLGGLKAGWDNVSKAIEEHRPELEQIGVVLKTMAEWVMDEVVPVIGTVLKWAFEQVGDIIGEVITVIATLHGWFATLADAGIALWNNALQPATQFIVGGFAAVSRAIAAVLEALGHIPGFDWARTAAEKLRGAAGEADNFASKLGKIPRNVPVTISVTAAFDSYAKKAMGLMNQRTVAALDIPGREIGGRVAPGRPYIVGEKRPELFVPDSHGTILPEVPAGGGGASPAELRAALEGMTFVIDRASAIEDRVFGRLLTEVRRAV